MSAYDDCAFDRCSIGDTDYDKAQVRMISGNFIDTCDYMRAA